VGDVRGDRPGERRVPLAPRGRLERRAEPFGQPGDGGPDLGRVASPREPALAARLAVDLAPPLVAPPHAHLGDCAPRARRAEPSALGASPSVPGSERVGGQSLSISVDSLISGRAPVWPMTSAAAMAPR